MVSKRSRKTIPAKHATSERAEKAEVAGQATILQAIWQRMFKKHFCHIFLRASQFFEQPSVVLLLELSGRCHPDEIL